MCAPLFFSKGVYHNMTTPSKIGDGNCGQVCGYHRLYHCDPFAQLL